MNDAEKLAKRFHETYERLAPEYSYKTREASAVPWKDVPDNNKRLMIAVAGELLASAALPPQPQPSPAEGADALPPNWWITEGIKQGGTKILGPFKSRELALDVRGYVEKVRGETYWVEELAARQGSNGGSKK